MNRISPEEVLTAYRKTDILPRQAVWVDYSKDIGLCGGCAMTALYVYHTGIRPSVSMPVRQWAISKYGEAYYYGFIDGWDDSNDVRPNTHKLHQKEYAQGIRDGALARELVNPN